MIRPFCKTICIVCALWATSALSQDMDGTEDHPLVTRFPETDLTWQTIETFRPYEVPFGPVTGYRQIDDWVSAEGRVTRSFYRYLGTERDYAEVYLNFKEVFEGAGFEILAEGISVDRKGTDIGGRQWMEVYLRTNPFTAPGEASTMAAGTSSSGGAGSLVVTKDRPVGRVYVVVSVEQHAEDFVGTLIDIVEVSAAEKGLVSVDAEAIGRDIAEKGRVVLDGIAFEFDSAILVPSSDEALNAVVTHLEANPEQAFYVVGHTDAVGGFDYNQSLSEARAKAVVDALVARFDIAPDRLTAHGVGPLVPVFTNSSDAGRDRNRRVELVERP